MHIRIRLLTMIGLIFGIAVGLGVAELYNRRQDYLRRANNHGIEAFSFRRDVAGIMRATKANRLAQGDRAVGRIIDSYVRAAEKQEEAARRWRRSADRPWMGPPGPEWHLPFYSREVKVRWWGYDE